MKKIFFVVMAAMMVLTLSCKKDKEPEAVDPLIDLTLICYSDNRAFLHADAILYLPEYQINIQPLNHQKWLEIC